MVAEMIWEGQLTGIFEGYAFDRLFALSDGTKWRQACETREYVYRERVILQRNAAGITQPSWP